MNKNVFLSHLLEGALQSSAVRAKNKYNEKLPGKKGMIVDTERNRVKNDDCLGSLSHLLKAVDEYGNPFNWK